MRSANLGLRVFQGIAFTYFFSQGVLTLIIPLYTRSLGFSLSEVGSFIGSFWIGTALIKVLAGRHSDLVGRKPYLAATMALAAVLKLFYPFVRTPVSFVVVMLLEGLNRGLYSAVRSPLITELVPAERRGRAFGWIGAVSIAGSSLGILSAGQVLGGASLPVLFVILSILLAIAAFAVLQWLPDVKAQGTLMTVTQLWRIPRPVIRLAGVDFLQNVATAPLYGLIIPFCITESLGCTPAMVGTLLFIDALLATVWNTGGGVLADKWHAGKLFAVVSALGAGVALLQLACHTILPFIVLCLTLGLLINMSFPALEAVDAAYVRKDARGFDFGVISLAVSLGAAAGNLGLGMLLDHYGPMMGFAFVGLAFLALTALFTPGFAVARAQQQGDDQDAGTEGSNIRATGQPRPG